MESSARPLDAPFPRFQKLRVSKSQVAATKDLSLLFFAQIIVGGRVAEQFAAMFLKPKSQSLTFLRRKGQNGRLQLFQTHGVKLTGLRFSWRTKSCGLLRRRYLSARAEPSRPCPDPPARLHRDAASASPASSAVSPSSGMSPYSRWHANWMTCWHTSRNSSGGNALNSLSSRSAVTLA
jgi:hypothetical protein